MKFKRSIVGAIVLLFALTACQEPQVLPTEPAPVAAESEPTAESASTDTAVPPPTNQPINEPTIIPPTLIPETAVTQPITEAITIEAADGLLLFATYTAPGGIAPFPGVLCCICWAAIGRFGMTLV